MFVTFSIGDLPKFRADIEAEFMRSLELVPGLAERVRAGRRFERFYGATDLPNFYRKPYGPGWTLVGDAGLHKDPLLALEICDAFRDAEFLAEAISEGLGGKRPMQEALAGYERRRNEASEADFAQNLAGARFGLMPPEFLQVRAAARNNPQLAREIMLSGPA